MNNLFGGTNLAFVYWLILAWLRHRCYGIQELVTITLAPVNAFLNSRADASMYVIVSRLATSASVYCLILRNQSVDVRMCDYSFELHVM